MTGILVVAHGSRWDGANGEVEHLICKLLEKVDYDQLSYAFLQFGSPSIEDQIAEMVKKGCTRIIVFPYFLTGGKHLCSDIPEILKHAAKVFGIEILIAEHIGGHPKLVDIMIDRIKEVMNGSNTGEPKADRRNEPIYLGF